MVTGSESSAFADVAARALREVSGWMLIVLGVWGMAANIAYFLESGSVRLVMLGIGIPLLFVLSGAALAPSVRKRIDNSHPLSAFGRTPVVEHRAIHPEEDCHKRCVICNGSVDAGMVRRYREDIAVAGIPLVFGSNGYNHYCLDCAREEMGLVDPAEAPRFDTGTGHGEAANRRTDESTDGRHLERESAR